MGLFKDTTTKKEAFPGDVKVVIRGCNPPDTMFVKDESGNLTFDAEGNPSTTSCPMQVAIEYELLDEDGELLRKETQPFRDLIDDAELLGFCDQVLNHIYRAFAQARPDLTHDASAVPATKRRRRLIHEAERIKKLELARREQEKDLKARRAASAARRRGIPNPDSQNSNVKGNSTNGETQ